MLFANSFVFRTSTLLYILLVFRSTAVWCFLWRRHYIASIPSWAFCLFEQYMGVSLPPSLSFGGITGKRTINSLNGIGLLSDDFYSSSECLDPSASILLDLCLRVKSQRFFALPSWSNLASNHLVTLTSSCYRTGCELMKTYNLFKSIIYSSGMEFGCLEGQYGLLRFEESPTLATGIQTSNFLAFLHHRP